MVVCDSPLQSDRAVLHQAGQLSCGEDFFVPLTIFDGIRRGIQTRAFAEAVTADTVDLELEVISAKWVFSFSSWHNSFSSPYDEELFGSSGPVMVTPFSP